MKTLALIFICMGLLLTVNVTAQIKVNSNFSGLPQLVPPQTSADLQLTARVNQQLAMRVQNFKSDNYMVYSQNGQVAIYGQASSLVEADAVIMAARTTAGVVVVINGISVAP